MLNRITIENGTPHDLYRIFCQYKSGGCLRLKDDYGEWRYRTTMVDNDSEISYLDLSYCYMSDSGFTGLGILDEYDFDNNSINFPDFCLVIPVPNNVIVAGSLGKWIEENWGFYGGNAYDYELLSYNMFEFSTQFGSVPKLIQAMSISSPDLIFRYEFVDYDCVIYDLDDDLQSGEYMFLNGEMEGGKLVDNSLEAYNLLFKLRPEYTDSYNLINGKYKRRRTRIGPNIENL